MAPEEGAPKRDYFLSPTRGGVMLQIPGVTDGPLSIPWEQAEAIRRDLDLLCEKHEVEALEAAEAEATGDAMYEAMKKRVHGH